MKYTFNTPKVVAIIKLVLSNMDNNSCGFHKIFKILYFAEKQHIANYGLPITGDQFIAMKDGPVPSTIYDIFKILRGDSIFVSSTDFTKDFEIYDKHHIRMIDMTFDLELISQSEGECLMNSIQENRNLTFGTLRDKSHDAAWNAANRDDEMSIFDIAKAGGASDELIKYISLSFENQYSDLK